MQSKWKGADAATCLADQRTHDTSDDNADTWGCSDKFKNRLRQTGHLHAAADEKCVGWEPWKPTALTGHRAPTVLISPEQITPEGLSWARLSGSAVKDVKSYITH